MPPLQTLPCLLKGGCRRAWHITAVQPPPDQLWETPLLGTPLQAFLPDSDSHSWSWTTIPAPTKGTAELDCRLSFRSHIKSLFSAEQTRPANKTSRWDLRFRNTATMNHGGLMV